MCWVGVVVYLVNCIFDLFDVFYCCFGVLRGLIEVVEVVGYFGGECDNRKCCCFDFDV